MMALKRLMQGFVKPDTSRYDAAVERFNSPEHRAATEEEWRTVWAPKFGLDPALTGKARAFAMAKATGMMGAIPRATQAAMRDAGDDFEEDA